jgi:hypothetical protein
VQPATGSQLEKLPQVLVGTTEPVALGGEQAKPAAAQRAEAKQQPLEIEIRLSSRHVKTHTLQTKPGIKLASFLF